jgi:MurNAc alpha-1-phosphate uridylyltransferase
MPMLALLAGGRATRMYPATLQIAKSMLPVAGEPFLGHQLRMLAAQGLREVVICCGHLEEQLRAYAGDGSRWGCSVQYSPDGDTPLGTGGALRRALPLLGERFLVMYGDSYLPVSLAAVWQAFEQAGKRGLMTLHRNQGRWDTSNVLFKKEEIVRYDKQKQSLEMNHIDYGLSCLHRHAFDGWPEGCRFDLADLLQDLLAKGQLAGYEVRERFYEIGSAAGYAETCALLESATAPASFGSVS